MSEFFNEVKTQPEKLIDFLEFQKSSWFKEIEGAAGLINKAENVIFSGMGTSFYAPECVISDIRYAKRSFIIEASELARDGRNLIGSEDVLVLLSQSGESVEIINVIGKLKGICPIIGITKPEVIPPNWQEIVYITPELKDVISLVEAGADIIAFDGTQRKRPNGATLDEIIKYIKINKRVSMADISTVEEGIKAAEAGADILSTTLSGYTLESPLKNDGPDFELLEELVKKVDIPVVLEGRIWEPEEVDRAFKLGAHCVVIGSAITRPQLITKRFVCRNK